MRILAVGAHPDDVELGCFGTLLERKGEGHHVYAVALAPGAYGNHTWAEIQGAWEKARDILVDGSRGKADYILGKFTIGRLEHSWSPVGFLDGLIRDLKIDMVLTHHYGEAHQDHTAAQKIAVSAARRNVKALYLGESVIYTHRNVFPFRPQVYTSFGEEAFRGKIAALQAYLDAGLIEPEELQAQQSLAKYRGIEMHRDYAEAFELVWDVQ